MKVAVNISRFLVGTLFIFSGLVKAIDPLGLAYKMQEFFEVWADAGYFTSFMRWLHSHATGFSVFMITLEVVLGLALLLGWQKKITTWLLFLLTLFFTFLTAYVLFSGKIRACGCFGDCIPLTPIQTFTKDIVLTVLIIVLLIGQKYIQPFFSKTIRIAILLLILIAVLYLQFYVQRHLPVKDCLPFKAGNNILELRKMPKDAVQDKFSYKFIYEKAGAAKEFDAASLPDSSWTFKDRKQTLIQKGKNNVPLINDFSLTTQSGNDTTEAVLSTKGEYYLLFAKDFKATYNPVKDWTEDVYFILEANAKSKKVFIISSQLDKAMQRYNIFIGGKKVDAPVLTCDGVAVKTAARSNVTLYKMNGPVIEKKWGAADLNTALKK